MTVVTVLLQVADCESDDGWWLAQDVNAGSSLVYVLMGLLIVAGARRERTGAFAALGLVVTLEGFGSVLFHGTDTEIARFLHDVPLIGLLGSITGWHVARATYDLAPAATTTPARTTPPSRATPAAGAPLARTTIEAGAETGTMAVSSDVSIDRGLLIGLTGGLATGAAIVAMPSIAANVVTGAAVVITLVAEWTARRRGMTGMWTAPLIALLVSAMVMWFLGTSDSPVCHERSLVQPHAAWHVLSALVLLGWVRRAWPSAGDLS